MDDEDLHDTLTQYVINNQIDLLRDALQGRDVDISLNSTLLISALKHKRQEMAEMLMDMGCDVDRGRDSLDRTALMLACSHGYLHLVQRLIAGGSNINHVDRRGGTPLYCAADSFNADILRLVLTAKGMNPDEMNQDADSRAEMNRFFLHQWNTWFYRFTPEFITLLVNAGCDVNQVRFDGTTPLHRAIDDNRSEEFIKTLVDHKADVHAVDQQGQTALHHAIINRTPNFNIIRMLIEADSNVNSRDNRNQTPLKCALWRGLPIDFIRLLVNRGADVNAVDNDGYTILMAAVMRDTKTYANASVVRLLLDAGCGDTINKRNNDGWSALHWSIQFANIDAVDVLLGVKGIKIDIHACHRAVGSAIMINRDKANECLRHVFVNAATVIQRQWRECYWNPSYLVCRKRLIKDFGEMENDVKRFRSE